MAVQIAILEFTLTNTCSPKAGGGGACVASIDNAVLENFEFELNGPPVERFKYPAGNDPPVDIPVWLRDAGWTPGEPVGGGDQGPTGFTRRDNFNSLHFSYRAPVTCSCPPNKKTTRYLRMDVDYDISNGGGPNLRVIETTEDGAPIDPQDSEVQGKKHGQTCEPFEQNGRQYALYTAWEEIKTQVDCPCDASQPCEVTFRLDYKYFPIIR